MTGKPTVTLVFAGDESKLAKSMAAVGKSAQKMDTDIGKAGDRISASNEKTERSFEKFRGGAVVAAAAVGAALVTAGKAAIDAASDQEQAMGGLEAVFKSNASVVKQWASESATAVGLSKTAYATLAAPLGASLKGAGLSLDEATHKTKFLITTGADLAATFGGTTADAVEAMGSALRGEFDPMERYGLAMSAAKVEATALAMGLPKVGGELSASAKMTATLALITEGAADAAGQFARESNTVAGRTQIQKARVEDLKASLGEKLLPAYGQVIDRTIMLTDWIGRNEGKTKAFAIVAGGILVVAFTAWAISATAAAVATFAATWPILAVIAAIVLLVAGIWMLARNWDAVWTWIKNVVGAAADWIVGKWSALLGWFSGLPGWFAGLSAAMGNALISGFAWSINVIIDRLNWLISKMNRIPGIGIPLIPRIGGPPKPSGGGGGGGGGGHLKALHTGGIVDGGIPGEEVMRLLQVGERVTPVGQAASAGAVAVEFRGNTDSVFASAFQRLVRDGLIVLRPSR